jgi:uncharacterized membrane protein
MLAGLGLIALLGLGVNLPFWAYDPREQDIYYAWLEGGRILDGDNPYARVLASDMRTNDKYATYLPGFYLLSAAVQALGVREFDSWLLFWRPVVLACNLAIAASLFIASARRGRSFLGLCFAIFWLCNRWTLYTSRIVHLDFLAILPLLAALALLPARRRTSMLLLGVSLTIKQLAVFVLPICVLWAWRRADPRRWRDAAAALAWVAIVPLIVSLPFLLWNADAFLRSILFSATRAPDNLVPGLHSLDTLIGMTLPWFAGLLARVPMVLLMALAWVAALRREVGLYTGSLLVFLIFLGFNSVLFMQYFVWALALVPLALLEALPEPKTTSLSEGSPSLGSRVSDPSRG